jgi:hypothetical protein
VTTIFWNIHGIIVVHFTQHGVSVTAVACQVALQHLMKEIRCRSPGLLTQRVLLLYYNDRPHTARSTTALPDTWLREHVPRPLYSLELDRWTFTFLTN